MQQSLEYSRMCLVSFLQKCCQNDFVNFIETISFLFQPSQQSDIEAKKAIVFLPSLLELFSVCRVGACGSGVDEENITVTANGAMLRVQCLCNNNHQTSWDSGPMIGSGNQEVAVINILISVYCLTIGINIQQVRLIFCFICS